MDVQVYDSLAPVAGEWDALADRAEAPPFLRPGWFAAWWGAFGRGNLEVFAAREQGRLVAVMPLARRAGRLVSPANVHSPLFAPVSEDAHAERALLDAILGGNARQIAVCSIDRRSASAVAIRDAATRSGRRLLWTTVQRSPIIPLPDRFADLERRLSKKFVTDLRRRSRGLARCGDVVLEVLDGSERLDDALAEAFRVEPSGWKTLRGTAITSRPETHRFYTDVARWAAAAGFLRLAFLRVDRVPVAFQYALEDGDAWWFLKGGVDPAFRRYAPGKLLVHALLERACARRLREFDLLGADEPWKRSWRPEFREIGLQHVFRGSALGFAERGIVAVYRRGALPAARWTVARAR